LLFEKKFKSEDKKTGKYLSIIFTSTHKNSDNVDVGKLNIFGKSIDDVENNEISKDNTITFG
jgi:hypothetical protein